MQSVMEQGDKIGQDALEETTGNEMYSNRGVNRKEQWTYSARRRSRMGLWEMEGTE